MEDRVFTPGSEWVYFKIYTGTKTADAVLKNEVFRFVGEMMAKDVISKWFFVRYSDPDFHIRLRLHLKDLHRFNDVFNAFKGSFYPLINNGFVWNIQCDTYKREIDRYGANSISLVEDVFFIDSEFLIRLLHRLNNENAEQQRWKLALPLIDSFLSSFSFDMSQRKELLNTMADNYKKEFGFTHHDMTKQLNDKYRFLRKEIENVMLWENETDGITEIIKERRQVLFPIVEKINALEKVGELQVTMKSLLTSLIHMTMNRWFRTKNRLHEMVIYEFLSRYYTSELAKKNYETNRKDY